MCNYIKSPVNRIPEISGIVPKYGVPHVLYYCTAIIPVTLFLIKETICGHAARNHGFYICIQYLVSSELKGTTFESTDMIPAQTKITTSPPFPCRITNAL